MTLTQRREQGDTTGAAASAAPLQLLRAAEPAVGATSGGYVGGLRNMKQAWDQLCCCGVSGLLRKQNTLGLHRRKQKPEERHGVMQS